MKKIALVTGALIASLNAFSQLSLNALHFDGGTQQAVIVQGYNSTNAIDTGDFTIEAWIKDDAVIQAWNGEEPILDNRENSIGGGSGFRLAITYGYPTFFVGPNGVGLSGTDLRDSVCHHIAISRNSGWRHWYVDGQLIGTDFNTSSLYSDAPSLYIGAKDQGTGTGPVWSFNGLIKEIRIWNIERTQSEIQANMGTILSPNSHLISYWRCNEGSGFTLQDYSGNGNNGAVGATWSTGCPGCLLPSASITANGSTTFCSLGTVTLNANAGTGLTYQWKKNGIAISGATNQSYIASASGSYTAMVTNACGAATSSAITVTVNSLPSATITPSGPTTFCSGGGVVLNVPSGTNKTYQWKKGANLISGATLSSYTATTGGNYRVIVTNTVTGCSKTTGSAMVVTANALPTATITPQGPTTFCAGGSVVLAANTGAGLTYKWKKGSNFISGATLTSYTATTGGNYRVQVTNSNGCSKVSALVAVSVPCKEGESVNVGDGESVFNVNVYPNPSSGDFVFEILNTANEKISINIYNMMGSLVLSETVNNFEFTIRNMQLTQGVYSAIITNGENKKFLRLIKTN